MREASLTVELSMIKAEKAVFIEIAGVAGRKQDAIKDRFGIHGSFLPANHFSRAMTSLFNIPDMVARQEELLPPARLQNWT